MARSSATRPPTSAHVAAAQQELKRMLDVTWWGWRWLFLEAKRLELELRRAEGGALHPAAHRDDGGGA